MKLKINEKNGKYRVNASLTAEQIFAMARELAITKLASGENITSAVEAKKLLQGICVGYQREIFGVIFLDSQHKVISVDDQMFRGTINCASVYPREIVKAALFHNAAALFVFHNHPSGYSEPSQADISITNRIKKALELVDVSVLDHFVVSEANVVSFAERGLM
jgi:DNA repair protein RadC